MLDFSGIQYFQFNKIGQILEDAAIDRCFDAIQNNRLQSQETGNIRNGKCLARIIDGQHLEPTGDALEYVVIRHSGQLKVDQPLERFQRSKYLGLFIDLAVKKFQDWDVK